MLQAAKGADAEMMRLLAEYGADASLANDRGTTPIMAAAGVEMFNPNEDSGTNEEALEALEVALQLGGDVNAANTDGDTPMHGAAWRGANDIILRLSSRAQSSLLGPQRKSCANIGDSSVRISRVRRTPPRNPSLAPRSLSLALAQLMKRGAEGAKQPLR
jgi:ankyrin repeat protein